MILTFNKSRNRFEVIATYEDFIKNDKAPKVAGFRWNPDDNMWWTDSIEKALQMYNFADDTAKDRLDNADKFKEETLTLSRTVAVDIDLPVPAGIDYFPFQKVGIQFMIDRFNVLLGDDMGVGKTIQLIGLINADETIKRALIICPATIKLNWEKELKKWLVRKFNIVVITSPDKMPDKPEDKTIYVINYDIIKKYHDFCTSIEWDLLCCDEVHRLKSHKAQRTKHILGGMIVVGLNEKKRIKRIEARRKVFMTGTPIPNRPIELWSIARALAPDVFNSWKFYTERYCDAHDNGFGVDYRGAANLEELQYKLRSSIMIRRTKAQVLSELPPKRRQIIELEARDIKGMAQLLKNETITYNKFGNSLTRQRAKIEVLKAGNNEEAFKAAVSALRKDFTIYFTEMAQARRETALAKLPACLEHLDECLEASGKIGIFCHHIDIIKALEEHFGDKAVSIYGDTPQVKRQENVELFQDPKSGKVVFIGGIRAAGEGITLTSCSHAIFLELDWVPGQISQCEDRFHRIGQENSVLIQHMVVNQSIDAQMAKTLLEKQAIADTALDINTNFKYEVQRLPMVPYTETLVSYKEMEEKAPQITLEQIEAVHMGLKLLAAMDTDFATIENGIGFSTFDGEIGHQLAECAQLTPKQGVLGQRLVNKYRRQLPAEIIEAAKEAILDDAEDIDFE